MRRYMIVLFAFALAGCQTYVPIAVRCEPPSDIVAACKAPDPSYAELVLMSQDPNVREGAFVDSVADIKRKLDECSAKQVGLSELLAACNKIVDRTVDAVKNLK